jgi:hypothetical protein
LATLRQQSVRDPWLAEVELYRKAALWVTRLDEFYQPETGQWMLDTLDRGLLRASQLAAASRHGSSSSGNQLRRQRMTR